MKCLWAKRLLKEEDNGRGEVNDVVRKLIVLMVMLGAAYGLSTDLERADGDVFSAMDRVDDEEKNGAYVGEDSRVRCVVERWAVVLRLWRKEDLRASGELQEEEEKGVGTEAYDELMKAFGDDCGQVIRMLALGKERVEVRLNAFGDELSENEGQGVGKEGEEGAEVYVPGGARPRGDEADLRGMDRAERQDQEVEGASARKK